MATRPAVTLSGQVRVHSVGWFPGLSLLARLSPPSPAHRPLRLQFEGSRSAQEIRSFWQNLEHPAINKQEWSARELGQLQAIAAAHGHLHWQKIADELGVRAGGPGRGRGSSGCTSPGAVGGFPPDAFEGVALGEGAPSTRPQAEFGGSSDPAASLRAHVPSTHIPDQPLSSVQMLSLPEFPPVSL